MRILVVDDNATNREILLAQFRARGMRPAEVSDGEAALRCLREAAQAGDPYQMAVLDMQMPGMDGEELGRAIRAEGALADTRLVMMTSLGQREDPGSLEDISFDQRNTIVFAVPIDIVNGEIIGLSAFAEANKAVKKTQKSKNKE